MVLLTIDTNCAINLFDSTSATATSVAELEILLRYASDRTVEIAITTRVEADLLRDKQEERRAALVATLNMFPVIPTIARWDISRWGQDMWAGDDITRLNDEIRRLLFPGLTKADARFRNKINDVDHVTGHKLACRDAFVTDDKVILRQSEPLQRRIGIVVMTPAQTVDLVAKTV